MPESIDIGMLDVASPPEFFARADALASCYGSAPHSAMQTTRDSPTTPTVNPPDAAMPEVFDSSTSPSYTFCRDDVL